MFIKKVCFVSKSGLMKCKDIIWYSVTLFNSNFDLAHLSFRYPNLKSVRELIYKRGYGKINKQRIGLTDNSLIEKSLGRHLFHNNKQVQMLLQPKLFVSIQSNCDFYLSRSVWNHLH